MKVDCAVVVMGCCQSTDWYLGAGLNDGICLWPIGGWKASCAVDLVLKGVRSSGLYWTFGLKLGIRDDGHFW
jgi:hypothetical protein